MKASEILSKAADLIEPPGKWCKDAYALTRYGTKVPSDHNNAHCFCAYGAIERAAGVHQNEEYSAHDALRRLLDISDTEAWNDAPERTQAEVVTALRQAAPLAKEQESR